ncbi:hypothetical protein [Streptacidiphilus cavernicola]|uniref:Uncharacterized protein n=1 Tax=Streptacidiphilus cavernicola TaxID=3342716 RepID=A0ABV6VNW6_9ACTN
MPGLFIDGLIARPTAEGFAGVVVHRDEPATLRHLMRHATVHGPAAAIRTLIEEHPSGWWSLPGSYSEGGQCACHCPELDERRPAQQLDQVSALLDPSITRVYLLQPERLELFDRGGGQWAARGAIPYDMWPALR